VALTLPPAADPTYLAYLRTLGLDESEAMGEVERRVSSLTRGLTRRQPVYADREERTQESIGEDYENRGLFQSGARLVAQQRAATDISRDRLEDQAQTADQIAGEYGGLARQVAGIRRSAAERELDTRDRQTGSF
jgi:hypothetical protein